MYLPTLRRSERWVHIPIIRLPVGMSLESKTAVARPDSKSLRATVPEGIVAFLGLQNGDTLEWKMEFRNNERFVEVKKAKRK